MPEEKNTHKEYIVTPWEVSGEIDYKKLICDFGTEPLTEELLARIKKHTGELHFLLRRKIFYSHRALNWILDEYEKDNKFFLYTGRGPSGEVHIGHLIPWILCKHLQDKFDVNLYFQLTDDEKFYFKEELTLEDTKKFAYSNALDVIALGFDERKTKLFLDTEYIKTLYPLAARIAKKITFSTVRATFGFTNENNLGEIFYTSLQGAPCLLENRPCLIPLGIDQDPHFRLFRDVAPKIGVYKPALIHNKMFPSLVGKDKMSSSSPEAAIYTTDSAETIKRKIMNAFTGGRATVEEQRKLGGVPEICNVFAYEFFMFMTTDNELKELELQCRTGNLLCGECKLILFDRVIKFIEEHRKRRIEAEKKIDKFMLRDCEPA